MGKKSKIGIIISITSLFLVTFLLIGLTYAYYRTRIIGNNSTDPSISVTSKKLEIVYEDGNATFSTENEDDLIVPGFIWTKEFTVENTGDEDDYYSVVLNNMVNNYSRTKDWIYELTNTRTNEKFEGQIAAGDNQVLLSKIAVPVGVIDTYLLKVTYVNSIEDQSEDMGKSLNFKIDISDEKVMWDSAIEGMLLYALRTNNTVTDTMTDIAAEPSLANEAVLSSSMDDNGLSYYFRGNVENNFVNFAGMCWRVVRVQGNGGIKLILEDKNAECNSTEYTGNYVIGNGSMGIDKDSYLNNKKMLQNFYDPYIGLDVYNSTPLSTALVTANKTFLTNKLSNYLSYLKVVDWCYNDNAYPTKTGGNMLSLEDIQNNYDNNTQFWYDSYVRLYGRNVYGGMDVKPSLECKGTVYNTYNDGTSMLVGALTADELAFAGAIVTFETEGFDFYLLNDYQVNKGTNWWTMSLCSFKNHDVGYFLNSKGIIFGNMIYGKNAYSGYDFRPSIVLRNEVLSTTNEDTETYGEAGTYTNPYVIN